MRRNLVLSGNAGNDCTFGETMSQSNIHKNRVLNRAPRRTQAFEFIQAEIAAGRSFPSAQSLANHMGWKHQSSARDCLCSLAAFDKVIDRKFVDGRWVFSLPVSV